MELLNVVAFFIVTILIVNALPNLNAGLDCDREPYSGEYCDRHGDGQIKQCQICSLSHLNNNDIAFPEECLNLEDCRMKCPEGLSTQEEAPISVCDTSTPSNNDTAAVTTTTNTINNDTAAVTTTDNTTHALLNMFYKMIKRYPGKRCPVGSYRVSRNHCRKCGPCTDFTLSGRGILSPFSECKDTVSCPYWCDFIYSYETPATNETCSRFSEPPRYDSIVQLENENDFSENDMRKLTNHLEDFYDVKDVLEDGPCRLRRWRFDNYRMRPLNQNMRAYKVSFIIRR